jgi:hypothetical protein
MIKNKEEFILFLEKLFPEYMWEEMPKYVIEAYAEIGEILSNKISEFKSSKLPSTSGFGDYSTGKCKIVRTEATDTFNISTNFLMKNDSTFLWVTDSVSLGVGEYETPELNWISLKKGTQHNLYINCMLQNVAIVAPYFYGIVTEVNDDGENPDLYHQGTLHNINPFSGESVISFRKRIREIPSKITKTAVEAIVQKYFSTGYITEGFEDAGFSLGGQNIILDDHLKYFFVGDPFNGMLGSEIFQCYFEVHIPFSNYSVDEMPILYLGTTNTDHNGGHLGYDNTDDWYDGYLCFNINGVVSNKSVELSQMCAELKDSVAAGISYKIFEDVIV